MEVNEPTTGRRKFLGNIATGAVAMGLGGIAAPLQSIAKSTNQLSNPDDPDEWFKKIKGKHRIVFDVTGPNEIMPFAWPRVFLMTNELTGTLGKDANVVVILRHNAIPYAMEDRLWEKYHFGDVFKIQDGRTKASSLRNPFWKPKADDYSVPGIGPVSIGINDLQESGVMFCACNMAITVFSAAIAQGMGMNAEDVKKDFLSGILPGVQVVPSGVWAVGRAQEHGCAYCFAG